MSEDVGTAREDERMTVTPDDIERIAKTCAARIGTIINGRCPPTIDDLMEIQSGDDAQWCVYRPLGRGEHPRLSFYDDDVDECSSGLDETESDEFHECGPTTNCFLDSSAVIHDPTTDRSEVVPHGCLSVLPGIRVPGVEESDQPFKGWVYAIALIPDVDIRRLKVGFTDRQINARLRQYRTANPTAILVGLWRGDRHHEARAHAALSGRIGDSEVFHVEDVKTATEAISAALEAIR